MNVVVFGANGRVGRLVVEKLVERGHAVTAFVYSEANGYDPRVTIVYGDVHDPLAVDAALEGVDVVVSCLGSWGTKSKDILTSGMRSIIPSMKRHGIRRIVSLTGADARAKRDEPDGIHRLSHFVLSIMAPKILADGEAHLRLLEQSDLDWTVVRSPVMNEKGSDQYTLTDQPSMPWATIHRHAVAHAMLEQIESRDFIQSSPYLHRR